MQSCFERSTQLSVTWYCFLSSLKNRIDQNISHISESEINATMRNTESNLKLSRHLASGYAIVLMCNMNVNEV